MVVEARRLVVRKEGRSGISDGSVKTGSIKTGEKTTAGISGGSRDAKTGSKRGGKIIDSPSMRTRKRLFEVLTEAGKRKR